MTNPNIKFINQCLWNIQEIKVTDTYVRELKHNYKLLCATARHGNSVCLKNSSHSIFIIGANNRWNIYKGNNKN